MVFVLQQIEKCRKQNKGLYLPFMDLTKAFDTISRKGLWEIMKKLGCPPKFLAMAFQLHETSSARSDVEVTSPSASQCKGCETRLCSWTDTLACMMLQQAMEDMDDGASICFHTDGSLFTFKPKPKHQSS